MVSWNVQVVAVGPSNCKSIHLPYILHIKVEVGCATEMFIKMIVSCRFNEIVHNECANALMSLLIL